ncbi:MAG TPA: TetR/AcrR family transcriptional regulator [Solirubrobacterales bacterium]
MASERVARARRARGRPPASAAGADSRTRLLDAGASVFAKRGYRAATVAEVVAAAGLSKGTFYWNFKSKEDLFQTLLEERIDRPARALMEITRAAPADRPTSSDVSAGLARLLTGERETLMLLQDYWAAATRDPRLARRYRRRQEALREALAETLEARHETTGVPLEFPARELATAFIALAEGLGFEALVDRGAVDPGLFGEVLSLVYDGLEARAKR